jgi:hypothetical protein
VNCRRLINVTPSDFLPFGSSLSASLTTDPAQRCPSSSSRFGIPVTTEELNQSIQGGVPCNTRRNTEWAVRVFSSWKQWRNGQSVEEDAPGRYVHDLHVMNSFELNYWLYWFIHEARSKDGKPYPPTTMQQLIAGIQRYIRDYYVKAGRIDIPNFWNVNFWKN